MNTPIKKVVLVYSVKALKDNAGVLTRIEKILELNNIIYTSLSIDSLGYDALNSCDLVISVGGDGTFIRASHYVIDKLLLGINSDSKTSEGGLTTLNETNLEKLSEILKGGYKIKLSERLQVIKNGVILKENAINEIYVGAKNQFHTSRYVIEHEGIKEEHRSSGVLVVSSIGSAAWYKSAGGKPFEGDLFKFLVREPFISRIFNSKLLSGEIFREEIITFYSTMYDGGVIAMDSNKVYDFNLGDKVEIKFSDNPLKIIKLK